MGEIWGLLCKQEVSQGRNYSVVAEYADDLLGSGLVHYGAVRTTQLIINRS